MPPRQTPRKRLPAEERRQQLLDVASRLFAERGYARTTTAELAKAAGVTEPVIYRHFSSKRDLFVAIIELTARETLRLWSEQLEQAQNQGERLAILLASNPMVALGDDEAGRYRVMLQAITETGDELIRAAMAEHFGALHAFIAREVSLAQERGQVGSRAHADMIAWILIDIALGFGVIAALGAAQAQMQRADGDIVEVLRRILLPRAHGHDSSGEQ